MSDKKTLGEAIFVDIESNAYLNELHENILFNYALKLFQIQAGQKEYNLKDALRFADLLSKSTHPTNSDSHKMWAQELIILLNELHPEDGLVKLYAGSVFSSAGNHQGLQIINSEYQDINVFEKIFEQFRNDYLTIPAAPEMKFFSAQKEAYDHLTDPCFSYSGPTSMGKSFIMRMFIKDEILHGAKKNYALIVPTKALINEVRSKIINDLEDNLKRCNYRVVTAASDIALEEKHNFIFVLTPERLLYLLISNPSLEVDYLFVDEAHKLSGKNSRGPFYYKVVDMLLQKEKKPHFIFASPNIPNPQVYLRLMNEAIESSDESKLATTYSPVVQIKFLMDLILSCFMVCDSMEVTTRRIRERFECDEALHISIEGYESLFVISDSNKKEPGTDTILTLRPVHPWDRMNEEEFMQCIKGIVPNPAVQIEIETNKGSELYSSDYFDDLDLKPLLDYSWNNIKNIRKIDIDLTCEAYGFKGKGCIGILIKNGLPAEEIEILSKDVEIDGEIYTLSSNIKYKTNCITETSTSISVDEDGEIDTNTSWSERFKSKASLSIHGIEVPYNLFPDYSNGMSKAALKIPFPFSFRLDIGVNSDLNLNSARDQIIYDEKWLTFEENLYRIICRRLKDTLSSSDWKILNEIIQKNNTDTFSRVANSFE